MNMLRRNVSGRSSKEDRSVPYVVLEGCGNGYAFVQERQLNLGNLSRIAREMSNALRTDGIVIVGDAIKKECDVRMRIFNKDGSEANMCGNALRSFPLFLRKSNVLVETRCGSRKVVRKKDDTEIEVDMGRVRMKRVAKLKNNLHVVLVDVGNPHCVVFLEDNSESLAPTLRDVNVKGIGLKIQSYFKSSTNVSFVEVISPTEFRQRTFERGSGETLACGTAACACVVAMFEMSRIVKHRTKRQRLISHLPGGTLGISWTGYTEDVIVMDGPAKEVSRGRFQLSELCFFEHDFFSLSDTCRFERIKLGHLQTPIHIWNIPNAYVDNESVDIFIKRDDMTGSGLAGNKVRKLEFLLADALRKGCDCVVTAGAIQSNHCRATAVAASRCNLDSFLILRHDDSKTSSSPSASFSGNLLLDRLSGAHVSLISKTTYEKRGGGNKCVLELCDRLRKMGKNPYPIPVGGSNALGTVGYVSMVSQELASEHFDAIFLACGSGGTAAGVALGNHLYRQDKTDVIAFGVCDTPDVFHDEIDRDMYDHLPVQSVSSRDILRIVDAKGLGY